LTARRRRVTKLRMSTRCLTARRRVTKLRTWTPCFTARRRVTKLRRWTPCFTARRRVTKLETWTPCISDSPSREDRLHHQIFSDETQRQLAANEAEQTAQLPYQTRPIHI